MPTEGRQSGVFCCYVQHLRADMTDFYCWISARHNASQPDSPDAVWLVKLLFVTGKICLFWGVLKTILAWLRRRKTASLYITNYLDSLSLLKVMYSCFSSFSQAVDEMNGKEINGKVIYVGRAQKRLERQGELKRKFDQIKQDRVQRYQVLLHHMHVIICGHSKTC